MVQNRGDGFAACMHRMALVLMVSLMVGVAFAPVAAASVSDDSQDAPWCTGYVQARCFDGANFCQLYVRRVVCVHL